MLDCYIDSNLRFLFEIQAIRPETSPFLSVKMAVLSSFFQMFIVLCIILVFTELSWMLWSLQSFLKLKKRCTTDIKQKVGEHGKNTAFLKCICFQDLHTVHVYWEGHKNVAKSTIPSKKVANFVKNLWPF